MPIEKEYKSKLEILEIIKQTELDIIEKMKTVNYFKKLVRRNNIYHIETALHLINNKELNKIEIFIEEENKKYEIQ